MTWEPGVSGNILGKPKGSKNKRPQLAKLLEPHAEALIAKAVEMALGGCPGSLRLCIERLIPKAVQEPIVIDLDPKDIKEVGQLIAFGKEVLTSVANGEISPSEGKTLSDILQSHRLLIENAELKKMLEEIQTARKQGR